MVNIAVEAEVENGAMSIRFLGKLLIDIDGRDVRELQCIEEETGGDEEYGESHKVLMMH